MSKVPEAEPKRQERRQAAYEATLAIAEAAAESPRLPELYARIHGIVEGLMYARNLYVALYHEREQALSISYFSDENASRMEPFRGVIRRPLRRGVSEYVIRTGKPLLATSDDLDELVRRGEIDVRRPPKAASWAGVPLRVGERTVGMMAVQSYRPEVTYTADDLDLLVFVSRLIAFAIVRRTADDELAERAAALERSNRELEHFAYVTSHDLQEPLRAVSGFLQLVERRAAGSLDEQSRAYIARSVAAAARMSRMISDLLDYARVTTRGEALVAVDSGHALSQALDSLSAAVAESGASVERGELPVVMADPGQLERIFQNLVGNAVKFRNGAPRIRVWAEPREREWLLSVQDNGIGIPPEHRERIFRVFQRLHPPDRFPGSGIGLAVCQRIVERHGGRIWVDGVPEGGSVFRFTLPRTGGAEA